MDEKASDFDFAVLIFSGDGVLESRGATCKAPRDNILFEMGLFVGRLGRGLTFYLFKPRERPNLPSDLAGTTGVEYIVARPKSCKAFIFGSVSGAGEFRNLTLPSGSVPHLAFRVEHDGYSITTNLPKLVSMTFGTEGWVY